MNHLIRNGVALCRILATTSACRLGLSYIFATALTVNADDATGLLRVDVETNAEVVAEMPFAPLGDATPSAFVSGPFAGSGIAEAGDSDRLYVLSAQSLSCTNAVYSSVYGWLDVATGDPTAMTVSQGDTLVFAPGCNEFFEPFPFFLYGRSPDIPLHGGSPRIRAMSVDPAGEFADISIFTRGLATDIFATDWETNALEHAYWRHIGRYSGSPMSFTWRDWALPIFGRTYLASDASRDSDGDGLPDELERRIYGTSPYLADTDGDGLDDALELAWGSDPHEVDNDEAQTFFEEPFEPPAVAHGPLAGQNGWAASGMSEQVVVQGETVYEGSGAVALQGGTAAHSATNTSTVAWIDLRSYPIIGRDDDECPAESMACFWFNEEGHPVMADGCELFTNNQWTVTGWRRWMRVTAKMDFASRTWDLYVDGVIVGENLALRGTAASISSIKFQGEGVADSISVTSRRPLGLSSDGDELPDEWEIEHFGNLSHDGIADSDGDGICDLDEFRAGLDPLAPNGDTDGDGLPDWWEAANGLNPFGTNDFIRAALHETFETPSVEQGEISGQNGWFASREGAGSVQDGKSHGGSSALLVSGGSFDDADIVNISHAAQSRAEVVWMDLWQIGTRGFDFGDPGSEAFAAYVFDNQGHPVLTDGDAFVTNFVAVVEDEEEWTRCSCRFDFPNRTWDFYLNGVLVAESFAMRGTSGAIHSMAIIGGTGYLDDIYIGFARPEGLSSDGDELPDEWEFRSFGILDRDGCGDLDGDGLTDAEEFAYGTNPALADTDGDGLNDRIEMDHGLDPLNPEDAGSDPDGDSLTSAEEIQIGTDWDNPDTDGDGMPDGWEYLNGTDPLSPDPQADPDGDGLINIEEMRHGTNPLVADTDGDGANDYIEIANTRGNPLVADISWGASMDACGRIDGATYTASTGTWRTDEDGAVYAAERAGSLAWRLQVPAAGADALAINIGQHNFYSKAATFDLSLYVDGLFVTRQIVCAPYGTREDAFFFLPEIPAGEHEFRLVWHNWEVNTFLAVYDLRFVAFGGPDTDGDGVADWKNHRASDSYVLDELPLESLVSPLCVEGRDLWRDVLEIEVEYPETNAVYSVIKTIGDGFYADIPLPTNGTAVVSMRKRTLAGSFPVSWKPLDVFGEGYATNALTIRTGDSLKIAPYGGDEESDVTISIADGTNAWIAVTNWTQTAATPYCFETNGMYLIEVAHNGLFEDDTAYALVDVVHSRFPKRNPAILMNATKTLDCPELSRRNILEHDSMLDVEVNQETNHAKGMSLTLSTTASQDLGMVSRLNDAGAISDAIQISPVWADNGTYYRVKDNYEDGSQLVEVSLLLGTIPEGTTVTLSIFVKGVVFEDGTRSKTLTADDFDEDGHVSLFFIRNRGVKTSVCHSTRIYQDGNLIYKNR